MVNRSQANRHAVAWWCVSGVLALSLSGCASSARHSRPRQAGPAAPAIQTTTPTDPANIDAEALDAAVARARSRLARFVGTPDLIESLYFEWFDRPYRRATVATALKTTALLEREAHSRRRGNGAIRDTDLAAMLSWIDDALQRATGDARRAGFLPHRMRFDSDGATSPSTTSPPRFAFVDRSSATRYDQTFGDFDLLTCLGTGAYGITARTAVFAESLPARAEALGVGIVAQANPLPERERGNTHLPSREGMGEGSASSVARAGRMTLQPLTLAELLSGAEHHDDALLAVIDPPSGETLGESLARRSLMQACIPDQGIVTTGWTVPEERRPAITNQTMWVHALMGQRLALVEGWRDYRDGSRLGHATLAPQPRAVETIAHTALDMLFHWDSLRGFSPRPSLAVAVDTTALRATDENRWTPEVAELFNTLIERQLTFDVIPLAELTVQTAKGDYRKVLVAANVTPDHSPAGTQSGTPAELNELVRTMSDVMVSRELRGAADFVAGDADGRALSGCLVLNGRAANGRPCFAMANLGNRPMTAFLTSPAFPDVAPFRDVLTEETTPTRRDAVRLAAYQIRVFMPTGGGGE